MARVSTIEGGRFENQKTCHIDSARIRRVCEPGVCELFRQPRAEYEVQYRLSAASDVIGHSRQLHAANDSQQPAEIRCRKVDDAGPERRKRPIGRQDFGASRFQPLNPLEGAP